VTSSWSFILQLFVVVVVVVVVALLLYLGVYCGVHTHRLARLDILHKLNILEEVCY